MLFSACNYFQLQWVKHEKSKRGREQTRLDGLQARNCIGPPSADKYVCDSETHCVSVNASKVISLEYIWTTLLPSYLRHIVSLKKGHSLHVALFVWTVEKEEQWPCHFLYLTLCHCYIELLWNLCFSGKIHYAIIVGDSLTFTGMQL